MSDYNTKIIRKYLNFSGYVQGVGFRYTAKYAAAQAGVTGWVRNDPDGSVSMEIQGTEAQIDKVVIELEHDTYIDILNIDTAEIPLVDNEHGFRVVGY